MPSRDRAGVPSIRPLAVGVVRRGSEVLVARGRDPATGGTFYRPLGGQIEFGEASGEALAREFREEVGLELASAELLTILENRFTYGEEPGHEIVFVYEATLAAPEAYGRERFDFLDTIDEGWEWIGWRSTDAFTAEEPLHPEGLLELLGPAGPVGAGRKVGGGGRDGWAPAVVAWDPEWAPRFRALGARLRDVLGKAALRIDHIGSTSVAGLAAKPVIDVQVSVAALVPEEPYRAPLEALGMVWRAANPDRSKRYFREAPGGRRTHVHVREAGSWSEQLPLLLREYLRAHGEEAAGFGAAKAALARRVTSRSAYQAAKGPLVWRLLERASAWSQTTGWRPPPSDA